MDARVLLHSYERPVSFYALQYALPKEGTRVPQRRCGTCRYFEEGSLAGAGWCRHPLRRELHHMVLVRKNELACQTGWDNDLWEPRESTVHGAIHDDSSAFLAEMPPQHLPHRDVGKQQQPTLVPPTTVTTASPSALSASPVTGQATTAESSPHKQRAQRVRPSTHSPDTEKTIETDAIPAHHQSGLTEPLPQLDREDQEAVTEAHRLEEPLLDEPIPPALSNLPRCCRTCRDFRPIGDGTTGWCANAFAFPERTKVAANALPCASSLGSWWTPHDEWWLEQADISHHGRPTPNVDEYLRQLLAARDSTRTRRSRSA